MIQKFENSIKELNSIINKGLNYYDTLAHLESLKYQLSFLSLYGEKSEILEINNISYMIIDNEMTSSKGILVAKLKPTKLNYFRKKKLHRLLNKP